jgi:hypothetical protein
MEIFPGSKEGNFTVWLGNFRHGAFRVFRNVLIVSRFLLFLVK